MKSTIHSPKILPWLARKAGISPHRAEVLWNAALRHARHAGAESESPAFLAAAMEHLLELIEAESLREDAASFGWRPWTRLNARLWQKPMVLLEALSLNCVRAWRTIKPLQFG